MNRALHDSGGDVLLISQFTLAADLRGGNKPGFSAAAPPKPANLCMNIVSIPSAQKES